MSWYCIEIQQEEIENNIHIKILKDFEFYQSQAGFPSGLALFSTKIDYNRPLQSAYYLPPLAEKFCPQLLRDYSFKPCSKPELSDITTHSGKEPDDLEFWYSDN